MTRLKPLFFMATLSLGSAAASNYYNPLYVNVYKPSYSLKINEIKNNPHDKTEKYLSQPKTNMEDLKQKYLSQYSGSPSIADTNSYTGTPSNDSPSSSKRSEYPSDYGRSNTSLQDKSFEGLRASHEAQSQYEWGALKHSQPLKNNFVVGSNNDAQEKSVHSNKPDRWIRYKYCQLIQEIATSTLKLLKEGFSSNYKSLPESLNEWVRNPSAQTLLPPTLHLLEMANAVCLNSGEDLSDYLTDLETKTPTGIGTQVLFNFMKKELKKGLKDYSTFFFAHDDPKDLTLENFKKLGTKLFHLTELEKREALEKALEIILISIETIHPAYNYIYAQHLNPSDKKSTLKRDKKDERFVPETKKSKPGNSSQELKKQQEAQEKKRLELQEKERLKTLQAEQKALRKESLRTIKEKNKEFKNIVQNAHWQILLSSKIEIPGSKRSSLISKMNAVQEEIKSGSEDLFNLIEDYSKLSEDTLENESNNDMNLSSQSQEKIKVLDREIQERKKLLEAVNQEIEQNREDQNACEEKIKEGKDITIFFHHASDLYKNTIQRFEAYRKSQSLLSEIFQNEMKMEWEYISSLYGANSSITKTFEKKIQDFEKKRTEWSTLTLSKIERQRGELTQEWKELLEAKKELNKLILQDSKVKELLDKFLPIEYKIADLEDKLENLQVRQARDLRYMENQNGGEKLKSQIAYQALQIKIAEMENDIWELKSFKKTIGIEVARLDSTLPDQEKEEFIKKETDLKNYFKEEIEKNLAEIELYREEEKKLQSSQQALEALKNTNKAYHYRRAKA